MATSKEATIAGKSQAELVKMAENEVNRLAAHEVQKAEALKVARKLLRDCLRSYPTDGSASKEQNAELDSCTMVELDLERELRQARADLRRARANAAKLRAMTPRS